MRDKCPICNSTKRIDTWSMDYLVPDGWELPIHNVICLCKCGMIYYDNDKTQADYDLYYKNRYDSDVVLISDETHARLEGLIELVLQTEPNKSSCIVDFGGSEGYVAKRLAELGYTDVSTVNVGDELPTNIDLLIASHVLEHIYDVHGVMNKLILHTRGKFLVDLPDAVAMAKIKTLPTLDYHQKHITHFSLHILNQLFGQYGYTPIYVYQYMTKPHNYPSWRVVYEKGDECDTYYESRNCVINNIKTKIEKLKRITYPVIVWGCGDVCLHLLTKVKLNIVHYVDNDPAFLGQTIGGIPVLDHVESDVPIVVIAQMQQSAVLKRIQDANLVNRIIVI